MILQPKFKNLLNNIKTFLFKDDIIFVFIITILLLFFGIWIRKIYFFVDFIIIIFIIGLFVILILWSRILRVQITKGELLTITSILVAILFFLYQDAKNNFNKNMIIDGINYYNCTVSCNNIDFLKNLTDKGSKFTFSYFERDIYFQNIDFIPKKYKEKRFDFLNTIYKIGAANRLLDLVLLMNTTTAMPSEFFLWRNQQILELSKDISKELDCRCVDNKQ